MHRCPRFGMIGRRTVRQVLRKRLVGGKVGERMTLLQMQDSTLLQAYYKGRA